MITGKELSLEFKEYILLEAQIATLQTKKQIIASSIIKNECPYKIGDCVEYSEWYRTNKTSYGVIKNIYFVGFDTDAIDNKWRIAINPSNKFFKEYEGRNAVHLGKNSGDKIKVI